MKGGLESALSLVSDGLTWVQREREVQIDTSLSDSPQGFACAVAIANADGSKQGRISLLPHMFHNLNPESTSESSSPAQSCSGRCTHHVLPPGRFQVEPHLASTDILSSSCRAMELGPPCTTTTSLSSYNLDKPPLLYSIHVTGGMGL